MSKKTSPCILSVEAAGELLGLDAQTVRICIRAGHFGDFARAIKSKPTNECYLYIISKFKLGNFGISETRETSFYRTNIIPYKRFAI